MNKEKEAGSGMMPVENGGRSGRLRWQMDEPGLEDRYLRQ